MSDKWEHVDDFDTVGWCWIAYKGAVRHAYYKHDGWFMFNENGNTGRYQAESITGVIAIVAPSLD